MALLVLDLLQGRQGAYFGQDLILIGADFGEHALGLMLWFV